MKKKIFIIAVAVCLAVLSIAGSSIAYFTDTDEYTNTFTTGNVAIELTANGTDDDTTDILDILDKDVYPSDVLSKDVTIANVSNSDRGNAYVGAIITLMNVDGRLGLETTVKDFLTGGIMASATDATVKIDTSSAGTIIIYVVSNSPLNKGDDVIIFEDIEIPAEWNNDQMAAFANVTLDVKAYATQTVGFAAANNLNEAEVAITTAFKGTAWDKYADLP